MKRLWDKGGTLDEAVLAYTAGEDHALDERLVRYDVAASLAHARMLAAQGLLTGADCKAICEGLEALAAAHARNEWHVQLSDEDGQTALERRLTTLIGAAGGRIHLGRSRNDQVLAAIRLYLRDAVATLSAGAAMTPRGSTRHCAASIRTRSALRPATARPGCRSTARRRARR
jgi:argininosuccinate lyase